MTFNNGQFSNRKRLGSNQKQASKTLSLSSKISFILLGIGILCFIITTIAPTIIKENKPYTNKAPIAKKKPEIRKRITSSRAVETSASSNDSCMPHTATPEKAIQTENSTPIASNLGAAGSDLKSPSTHGLKGTFYNFQQTAEGTSSGIEYNALNKSIAKESLNEMSSVIGAFCQSWNPSVFNKYYEAKEKYHIPYVYMPSVESEFAHLVFNAKQDFRPGLFAAVFRGKVRAPKTGRFRFVGMGNHMIVVRFKKDVVLEAGWAVPSMYDPNDRAPWDTWAIKGTDRRYQYDLRSGRERNHEDYKLYLNAGTPIWNRSFKGLLGGKIFTVEENEICEIEVLLADPAGGALSFFLLIEDIDKPVKLKDKNNQPLLDIFRTNKLLPDEDSITKAFIKANAYDIKAKPQFPIFNKDSLIWTAVP